jgi:hypothetical protein
VNQETTTLVEPGTAIIYTGEFRDVDDALADPERVGFALINPNGQQTNFIFGTDDEVTKASTGVYRFTIVPQVAGEYEVQAVGSGTVWATGRRKFRVGQTRFTAGWIDA